MEERGSSETPNPDVSDMQEYRKRLYPSELPQPDEFSELAEHDDATLASFYFQQWSMPINGVPTSERILDDIASNEKLAYITSDDYLRSHGATLNFAGERYVRAMMKTNLTETQARALEMAFRVHFVYQVAHHIQTVVHPALYDVIRSIKTEGD
tara:strand:- start:470 stop:931 length:462 start_codon:yes stop_codon:yes gene_type:complete